ncbi:MAG: copper-binding protein [Sphingomicrobium sp.]
MNRLLLAPLLGLALIGPAPAAPPVASATITLDSYRFTPGPIYLAGGVPVRLVLTNRAGKKHDFTAREFFRSAQILSGRAPGGEISVDGGKTKVIDLIPARGTYKVHCGKFGHSMFGMTTTIIVG